MKTPFIPKLILLFILFFLYSAGYAQQRDSVTIRGQVTDYNGQPIDSCSIFWQSPSFDDIKQAITDKNGYYTTRIPKRRDALHPEILRGLAFEKRKAARCFCQRFRNRVEKTALSMPGIRKKWCNFV